MGNRDRLSRVPSADEWKLLHGDARKQALVGVCFAGIKRLPKDQQPPRAILLQWFAAAEKIRQRNVLLNQRAKELSILLGEAGFKSSILKGQGVASHYHVANEDSLNSYFSGLGLYRQSGDIDVWVDGDRNDILCHMKNRYPCGRVLFHHVEVEVFDDVPVEVHFVPSFAYSWLRYRAYQRFFEECKEECFVESYLGFSVPSLRFNTVYVLLHIYRHVFQEGIGLRQLMDYYFVLREGGKVYKDWTMNWIRRMGLERFAAAVMYVEQEVFGLQEEYMLCKPDEKAGRFLLSRIMRAGNFGQYDPRIRDNQSGGPFMLYFKNVNRLFGMVQFYPSEVLWAPVWKIWHYGWRKLKEFS